MTIYGSILESTNTKETWEFKPLISIGKIRFGMTRDQVHQAIGKDYKEFRKTNSSKNTTDNYSNFHVFYTSDNKVEAVEIFSDIKVTINGFIIFPTSIEEVKQVLGDVIEDKGYLTQVEKSVGIQVSNKTTKSICVGCKGYYQSK